MKNKRWINILLGVLVAVVGIYEGRNLLLQENIDGNHFVTLVLGLLVIGIVISFLNDIAELSIAGNMVKFRQVKEEADQLIAKLDEARIATFRILIRLAGDTPITSPNLSEKDARLDNFLELYQAVEESELTEMLCDELLQATRKISQGQYYAIHNVVRLDFNELVNSSVFPEFDALRENVFKFDFMDGVPGIGRLTDQEKRKRALEALDEYKKIDAIRTKLESY